MSTTLYGQILPFACTGSIETYAVKGYDKSVFNWQVEGGTVIQDFNDSIIVKWHDEPGNRELQVIEITEFNCMGNPIIGEVEVRSPQVDLGGYFEICEGEELSFDATVNYPVGVSYSWHNGSSETTYTTSKSEIIWVRAIGDDGCINYDTATLVVNKLPRFSLGGDTILCGNQTAEISVPDTVDYSFIDWSDGSTFDYFEVVSGQQVIWAEITDENGCKFRDTLRVENCEFEKLFAGMPNTITPNGDGDNDEWYIPYIGQFPDAVVEIFDRWGRLIFRTEDAAGNLWKGQNFEGDDLPMGAYYYVIDLNYPGFDQFSGTVNIIK